tara:strand:- start:380 stop:514 length:135 start_codon:yes stop_codon:yes gene_type:complete
MNSLLISSFVLGGAIIIYLIFLAIGFGGVSQNRRAQGLDKDSKK